MRQIAEQAGLALGGIYNHFASKEDILTVVMIERNPYLDIVPALEAAQGETIEALVRDAAARMLSALENHPDDLQLMFVEIVEFKGKHFPQLFEGLFPQIIGFAHKLQQKNGTLRPIPPPTLIRTFVGFFCAYFMTEWLMGDQFLSELSVPRGADAHATNGASAVGSQQGTFDHFVDIYLHGILDQ
jgi:AcrR family transcriptional regulator